MSLVNDLKKSVKELELKSRSLETRNNSLEKEYKELETENKSLKELNNGLVNDLEVSNNKVKELSDEVVILKLNNDNKRFNLSNNLLEVNDLAITKDIHMLDRDKSLCCANTKGDNITEGEYYFVVDTYKRRGRVFVDIVDNLGTIKTFNREKYFAK